ncbi:MAG: DUF1272 domain-containing protein, partial [Phenylobacterium sp.]
MTDAYIDPDRQAWEAFKALPRDRPIQMLNLIRLRERAEYPEGHPNHGKAISGAEARICSFECTFCADCASQRLGGKCPNCGGVLVVRPSRAAALLARFP